VKLTSTYLAPAASVCTMARRRILWTVPLAAIVLVGVASLVAAQPAGGSAPGAAPWAEGAVFTATNSPSGNQVWAFTIGPGGSLIPAGHFGTGGTGTGVSLADQGSLALSTDHRWLFVVNAGSNTVSVFQVNRPGGAGPILSLADQISSHGVLPVSVTVHGSLVYVLNAGTSLVPGNIFGFYLADHGLLFPLRGSSRSLSTSASTSPAEILFNPAGTILVVSEKNTSVLDSYAVGYRGYASGPLTTPSNGATPYGFAFGRGDSLVVSDAGPGALTSYHAARSGSITLVTPALPDGQAAACWVATVDDGQYAVTSNAHSDTISSYSIGAGDTLTLVTAVDATTGAADTDLAVGGAHGSLLFVYDAGAGEIQEFGIGSDAGLSARYAVFGLPGTTEGLAAF
jgi:6-phosphogluconolactonase